MKFNIRPAQYPSDYASLSAVMNAASPAWPRTASELEYNDQHQNPEHHLVRFVATNTDAVLGFAAVGHDSFSFSPDKYFLRIYVQPEFTRQGVGTMLLQTATEHVKTRQATLLQAMVNSDEPAGVAFAEKHGYKEWWRRTELRLHVNSFDATNFLHLENILQSHNIQIQTYDQLAHDPLRDHKIWQLDWELMQDVPFGTVVTQTPLAQFQAEELHKPSFLPAGCFIATHNDDYIGFTSIHLAGNHLGIGMTGVQKQYRGLGLATLLKVRGIQFAQALGKTEIRTHNDAANTAMLSINTKLGFVRKCDLIRLEKHLK